MKECVCSIDLGSSSIKAALVDDGGDVVSMSSAAAPPVEGLDGTFDAGEYVRAAFSAVAGLVGQSGGQVAGVTGIALSSQRATLVVLDEAGEPACPAFSWQGASCESSAGDFYQRFGPERFSGLTGLPPSHLYTVAKLAHLIRTAPELLGRAGRIVTLHDYVLQCFGADDLFVDPSNASATGLFDIASGRWSEELLAALGISEERLPQVRGAGFEVGQLSEAAAAATGLKNGIPLFVGGGDQQCALLGSGGLRPGDCVLSLGTAAAAMVPLPHLPDSRNDGILLARNVAPDQWMAEGFMNSFGSASSQVSGILGCEVSSLESMAVGVPLGANGLLFLPFLDGIGTPDFDGEVRGSLVGLSLSTGRAELARAALEGLALEIRRLVQAFERAVPVKTLKIVGGGQGGELFPQLLSDITGLPLVINEQGEAATMGAAAIAWHGAGRFDSLADAAGALLPDETRCVQPETHRQGFDSLYTEYLDAVSFTRENYRRRHAK